MDVLTVAFVATVGIQRDKSGHLYLEPSPALLNHVGSLHAGAEFTLAETCSGLFLQELLSDWLDSVDAVVLEASIKYHQSANEALLAYCKVCPDQVNQVKDRLAGGRRSLLRLAVELKSRSGQRICTATFQWFLRISKPVSQGIAISLNPPSTQ